MKLNFKKIHALLAEEGDTTSMKYIELIDQITDAATLKVGLIKQVSGIEDS